MGHKLLTTTRGGEYKTWTHWGRVGEIGQSSWLGDGSLEDAIKQFETKFKGKSGHKWQDRLAEPKKNNYTFIEKDYGDDSPDDEEGTGQPSRKGGDSASKGPDCTLTLPVQQLMTLIFNTDNFARAMAAMNYDSEKLPLGKLSKTTISRGYEALKRLAEVLADETLARSLYQVSFRQATEQLSDSYYTFIPHSFGRHRPRVLKDKFSLEYEIQLLDSLSVCHTESTESIQARLITNGDAGHANLQQNHERGQSQCNGLCSSSGPPVSGIGNDGDDGLYVSCSRHQAQR